MLRSDLHTGCRKINLIVLHVSDTRPSQNYPVDRLIADHQNRGFGPYAGYHFYIQRDGTLYYTRPVQIIGCHVVGHNANSLGICSEGGHRENEIVLCGRIREKGEGENLHVEKYEDNRTAEQMIVLHELLTVLHELIPNAKLCGHHDLNPAKKCPCMDPPAAVEYAYIFGE